MYLLAPLTQDVLPLVSCKACGMDAPVRAATRDGIVKWAILMNLVQDGTVLYILYSMHTGPSAMALEGAPMDALVLTLLALLVNLPRRLAHFVLASCEAAFREKEELADDARISMYAAQKMAFKASSPPKGAPPEPVEQPKPKPRPPSAKPVKTMSFREQMKAGVKPGAGGKSLY